MQGSTAVKMQANAGTELIQGAVGKLEVRFNVQTLPAGRVSKLMVLSHPHPLYSGTMNNKVITTIEREAHKLGFSTLAYNFRGVGQSDGDYDQAEGEVEDLLAVAKWGLEQSQAQELHLAGFSFGSFVSLKALTQLNPNSLVTVAPPVGLYDFRGLSFEGMAEGFKWSLIQGGQDEVVCAQEILDWVRGLEASPDVYWREQASHFFHGELIWLRKVINLIYG